MKIRYDHYAANQLSRFWGYVEVSDNCWLWLGNLNKDGYGRFIWDGFREGAHRIAYRLAGNTIPHGLNVLHHCDNPSCVRANHLYAGTQKENGRDMAVRKRHWVHKDRDAFIEHINQIRHIGTGEKNGSAKLTEKMVLEIRARTGTNRFLAKEYGIPKSTIQHIRSRRTWRHI